MTVIVSVAVRGYWSLNQCIYLASICVRAVDSGDFLVNERINAKGIKLQFLTRRVEVGTVVARHATRNGSWGRKF